MKTLVRLLGVFVLVVILAFPASAMVLAQGGEDWVVYVTVTTSPDIGSVPGVGSQFGFGAKDGASDGYDAGEGDEIAPPDPMSGINGYFYYPDNPPFQKNLIVSVTAPGASITWPLLVKMVGETGNAEMSISWPDISSVPAKYTVLELQDTGGTTLADMRSVDHYTFSATQETTYNFQIRVEADDTTPPTVTDNSPVGSGVSVGSNISVTFSEAMDEGSVENAFSIVPAVPGSFSWADNTLTFDPTANLADSTPYTVTVNGTAEDLAGNGLDGNENGSAEGSPADDYTWSFTTEVVTYYTLTVSCDPEAGGSVDLIPDQPLGGYEDGTPVELTANANPGYAFGSWSGDLSGSTNPDTITMNSNKSVTAHFVLFSAPGNVDVMGADPGVESITVTSIDLGGVDTSNMPEDIDPQEAYVVDSTGTGSFTLTFTGITSASQIVIYKVVDSTWTQIAPTAITVIDATTIEVTMEVGDPILVFATPTGAPPPVGGDAFLPNRLLLLIPWFALGVAIIAGAVIVARRRRPQS